MERDEGEEEEEMMDGGDFLLEFCSSLSVVSVQLDATVIEVKWNLLIPLALRL